MEQRERELDSWDALVEETIDSLQPPSFLREMDQRFSRGNCLVHTTVAKSEASPTRDSPDKTSASSEKARYKPLPSSHPYSSRSENGETSDKETRKEKKRKQHRRDAEQSGKGSTPVTGVDASSTAGRARPRRKDSSQITCFNCEKKGHYATSCPEPRKDVSSED